MHYSFSFIIYSSTPNPTLNVKWMQFMNPLKMALHKTETYVGVDE
jgi:hypothetical protein